MKGEVGIVRIFGQRQILRDCFSGLCFGLVSGLWFQFQIWVFFEEGESWKDIDNILEFFYI